MITIFTHMRGIACFFRATATVTNRFQARRLLVLLVMLGATALHTGCGSVSALERIGTCTDGIKNGEELGIDCGGEDDCQACIACTEPSTCQSGICHEQTCATSQRAQCIEAHPKNATSIQQQVAILFTVGQGWSKAEVCAWECDTDFDREGDECVDERIRACRDVSPDNATADVKNIVETYTSSGGWKPIDCSWDCKKDYFRTPDDTCINERPIDCIDNAPDNATAIPGGVETYANGAWSGLPECAWNCDKDYFRTPDDTCINERPIACIDNAPDNATAIPGGVETYANGAWSGPPECEWDCNAPYEAQGDTCVLPNPEKIINNVAFLTSVTYAGNLGGLDGADAICQKHANNAGLPANQYRAWLSTSDEDAAARIGSARGWVRPDGLPVF